MFRITYIICFFALTTLVFSSCQKDNTKVKEGPSHAHDRKSGGENFTTLVKNVDAFGASGDGITKDQSRLFASGNALFRTNWVIAPSSVTSLDGLGPVINAKSCGSCHFKDGRGAPPDEFDVENAGLLFRISLQDMAEDGSFSPHPTYGSQLQDRAIISADYEAKVKIDYEIITGNYADGSTYTLRKPIYRFEDWQYGEVTEPILTSPRISPQVIGLGLIENISDEDIIALQDENDIDGDGISGRINYVPDLITGTKRIGRYGWKANVPNIEQQNAAAFNGDMGLTSNLFPKDDWTSVQESKYPNIINGGEPEITDAQMLRVTTYIKTLSVPATRNIDSDDYSRGKKIFTDLKCASCHNPTFTTTSDDIIEALHNQKIRPYTDLLLHDMGPQLADNKPDFMASGSEWKTPPLWGIGMIPVVNGHTRLLHDGRARNVEEAILWHGGEAEKIKENFKKLTQKEREDLIFFVNSL